jgi:hypothetical protein
MQLGRYSYDRANAPSPEVQDEVRNSSHMKRHRPCVVEDSDSSDGCDGESERGNMASGSSGMLVVLKYRQREPNSPPFLKPAASRSPDRKLVCLFGKRCDTNSPAGMRRSSRIQNSYKNREVNYNTNKGWGVRLRRANTTSPTPRSPEPEMTPCNDLPPERQSRADEYIRTLTAIDIEAEDIAQFQCATDTDNEKCQILTKQLPAIEEAEIKGLEEAERIYERAIKAASMRRDRLIGDIKARTKAEKEEVEKLKAECIEGIHTVEARISETNAAIEDLRKRKLALETEGGFELGLDVGLMKRAKKR